MSTQAQVQKILSDLKKQGSAKNRAGMSRFGIKTQSAFGVSVVWLRKYAKQYGKDHALALALWKSAKHEARILAAFIDEPSRVSKAQMNAWVKDFDSWDVCDQVCASLFDKTPYAFAIALQWAKRKEEFVRRAGFALMAALAWHHKTAEDRQFVPFLRACIAQSGDERNFVKKAVNWALRQIGKRNRTLHSLAIETAKILKDSPSKSGRWIALDALRELQSPKIKARIPQS
ncbi:MAG: DNA alkylation repair protein [Candidatus Nomurabacteria bacterium]|nr:MAG: DNA alkylation repair protein [Candidatus Nomurabacteria bacterium]